MSEDVAAVVDEALRAHLHERIDYHGPYGATSQEQWQMDTEKQFVRELLDGELRVGLLAALTAEGIACVYVPEGVAVSHGARLVWGWQNRAGRQFYAIAETP